MADPVPTPRTNAAASDGWSGDAVCVAVEDMAKLEREHIALQSLLRTYLAYGSLDGRVERQPLRASLLALLEPPASLKNDPSKS
jgi:hypothetical protein